MSELKYHCGALERIECNDLCILPSYCASFEYAKDPTGLYNACKYLKFASGGDTK